MNYIIFGAGKLGKCAMDNLGIPRVRCFVDNNPEKTEYFDKKVIRFNDLKNMDLSDAIIVIACEKYQKEMEEQLLTIPNVKYFIFQLDYVSCELPHYYLNKRYEAVTYNRILSMYNLEKYNKIAILGNNERLPYLISEIAIHADYANIAEVIITNSEIISQSVGISCVKWEDSTKDFDCLLVNLPRNYSGLDDILKKIGDNVDIIDIYDADCVEKTFIHPELIKYKDIHKGKRIFLIGNGPSVKIEDLDKLYENDEICIGFNKIYRIYDKTPWRADYIGMYDQDVIEDCLKDIDVITGELLVGDSYHYERPEKKSDHVQYFHCINGDRIFGKNKPKFSNNFVNGVYEGYTVVYTMGLQLAAYMGASEIYLIGVDNNYISNNVSDKCNHFIDNYFLEGEGEKYIYPPQVEKAERAFLAAEEFSRKNGFRIFNATRGGKLEVFERVDFDKLFE